MPRPSVKHSLSRDQTTGLVAGSGVVGPHSSALVALNVDAVCEKLKQIDGMDQSMIAQYIATIRKANINGRVLTQCSMDELKKEMNMNFGDWHLFKSAIQDMKISEMQQIHPEEARMPEPVRNVGHSDIARRPVPNPDLPHADLASQSYDFTFSFEELNTLGFEEAPRNNAVPWQGKPHRTPSLTSLNSQESNDILRLTDKVQAEYRDAYREYIAQMAQIEGGGVGSSTVSGRSSPLSSSAYYIGQSTSISSLHSSSEQDKAKDGESKQEDGRKPFLLKRNDVVDYTSSTVSTTDASPLDPITEEDEKSDQSGSKLLPSKKSAERSSLFQAADMKLKGSGLRYQKLPSDEDESGPEESDNTPLLKDGKDKKPDSAAEKKVTDHAAEPARTYIKTKEYLSDAILDKKDSSDSGVRSNESSPNHSLNNEGTEDSQLEKANLIELEDDRLRSKRGIPNSLSGLQDHAIARMSICSEDKKSPSESSLIASSPEENWPTCQKGFNLNRTPSTVTLNNNTGNQNFDETAEAKEESPIIVVPGSSPVHNENLKRMTHKRGQRSGYSRLAKDASELHTVTSSDTAGFAEERESIL